ncbi:glutamyl-tRNA reductase [bacterium]|nr:glutamyl-tRNA reductase [bacterium]
MRVNLGLIGLSHKTAPLRVREKYSFSKKQIPEIYKLLYNDLIREAVVLSTCNRTEVYVTTPACQDFADKDYSEKVREFLCNALSITNHELRYFYFLEKKEVIKHLFKVSSGIASQVVGETQILGQVKNAYFQAKESGMTNGYLDKLFQKAIEVGKIVREKTKISEGNISIGSVALKMIENLYGGLKGKKILIIGTGKISELVAKYLVDRGIAGTFVANRNYEKAKELAEKINGKVVRFNFLRDEIRTTDIVISATACPHLILKKEMIQEIMKFRKEPLCIMDLALPRDVDPEIKNINKIFLYNLDALNLTVEENYKKRIREAQEAEKIIKEEGGKFWNKEKRLKLVLVPAA